MSRDVVLAVVVTLIVTEATDVSPWIAIRLVRWAAKHIYAANTDRAAQRGEEWEALISKSIPTKISKLFFGLVLGCTGLYCIAIRRVPTALSAVWRRIHPFSRTSTGAARASDSYFDEIEERRYGTHYHLPELFASLAGQDRRLLEVGCGIGVDSIQLARRGFEVTAVDLTDNALAVARQFAARRGATIDFRLGNAEGLDFPDGSFDVVYSFGVLHHTPDIERSVAEVHRVLRPGGTALVMLYHRNSLVNLVHRALRLPYESPRDRKDHCPVVYTFSRRGVRRLFRDFATVDVHADYPFTYGFGPLTTRLPLGVRRRLGRAIGWHLMITATR